MADELTGLLRSGLEAKRRGFAGEDFASDYGRSVIGRVKRRRVASATAVGGGAAVAVGVVAAGAWQLPWAGIVVGGPGASPSVVCTTTTPDAVAGSEPFTNFSYAWSEEPGAPKWQFYSKTGTDSLGFAAWDGSTLVVTPHRGPVQRVDPDEDGVYRFTLGDITVTSDFADGPESVLAATIPVEADVDSSASSVSVVAEDGTVLGRAIHMSDGTLALVVGDSFYPLVEPDGLTYSYVDDAGQHVKVTLVDTEPAQGSTEAASSPSVTCVTTTPEPSTSASPTSSPAISAQPSASPDPAVSDSFGAVASPFQCGFELASAEPDPAATFRDLHWVTADAAETSIRAFFQTPDSIALNLSGDSVPIVMFDFDAGPEFDSASGVIGPQDPQGNLGGYSSTDGVVDTMKFATGAAYVLVQDGAVVATYVPDQVATSQYIDSYDPDTGTIYGLNVEDAFTRCSGGDVASLGDTDLYAVAGWIAEDTDGVHGPLYGWMKIEPQG